MVNKCIATISAIILLLAAVVCVPAHAAAPDDAVAGAEPSQHTITTGTLIKSLILTWKEPPSHVTYEYKRMGVWYELRVLPAMRMERQFLKLPLYAEAVRLTMPEPDILDSVQAYAPFEPIPREVQRWRPPVESCDILIIVAHPDDDLLYFGGTLPLYSAQLGYNVQTVFMTDPSVRRNKEALAGQWTAGGRLLPHFGTFRDRYTDTLSECERLWGREETLGFIVECVRRFKPAVILTHDLDGEYGHGAHRLTSALTLEAMELVGDASAYPASAQVYGLHTPQKLYLHLYPQNKVEMDWSVPIPALGGESALQYARDGFQCHVSQQGYGLEVRDRGSYSSTRFGLAWTMVGEDVTGGDFLEHLSP